MHAALCLQHPKGGYRAMQTHAALCILRTDLTPCKCTVQTRTECFARNNPRVDNNPPANTPSILQATPLSCNPQPPHANTQSILHAPRAIPPTESFACIAPHQNHHPRFGKTPQQKQRNPIAHSIPTASSSRAPLPRASCTSMRTSPTSCRGFSSLRRSCKHHKGNSGRNLEG